MKSSFSYTVSPVAAAVAAALNPGISVAQDSDVHTLDEIIVTATKREVSVQDIPASIQAITQESLAAMGAKTMEDFARFVPSVNVVTYGAGQSTVVFRGAITGSGWLAQSTSSVYLDEISVTQTGSQPSIRAVDIQRIEALSGPQGTLYGSDAQAGTMRILTNQPVMNEFEAIFDGELRGGSDSDMSYRGSLVFNVPLVEDSLAMRLAVFNDRDGGFIDNVYGHTADWHGGGDRSDPANNHAPSGFGTLDNAASVDGNWNDEDVSGARIHLRWEMNEDWAVTGSYHYQTSDAGADSVMDPFVGDLQVVRFHDDWREEEFNMASLKVEGDLGFAQLVAAVSYYDRTYESVADATTYVHYWSANYCHETDYNTIYDPNRPYYWLDPAYYFGDPNTGAHVWWGTYCSGETIEGDYLSAYWTDGNEDKVAAEIRLQGGGDTLEWIVGGYYEESNDDWLDPFHAPTPGGLVTDQFADSNYANTISRQFNEFYYGEDYSEATSQWSAGQTTSWEQKAIFGEATWHINDSWDLTAGGRYFDRNTDLAYWVNQPGRKYHDEGRYASDEEYREANNGLPPTQSGEDTKFIPKLALSYKLNDDTMMYGLYTEGQRQGGANRGRGEPFFPKSFDSDLMKNHEVGYRSSFGDGKGRLNLTVYHMKWEEYQLQVLDPSFEDCIDPNTGLPVPPETQPGGISIAGVCGQPWQTVIANLGDAHITGANVSVDYAPNEKWVLGFNYEKLEAETDSDHNLNDDPELEVQSGWRLPLTPDFKAAAWAEYHQPTSLLGANNFFVRLQWSFTGESVSRLEPLAFDDPTPQQVNPAYNIGDIRAGLVGDDWQVDLFINNVTDERAFYAKTSGPPIVWQAAQIAEGREHHQDAYVNRPMEFGVRYMKRWGD